jgi:hypothetical protein
MGREHQARMACRPEKKRSQYLYAISRQRRTLIRSYDPPALPCKHTGSYSDGFVHRPRQGQAGESDRTRLQASEPEGTSTPTRRIPPTQQPSVGTSALPGEHERGGTRSRSERGGFTRWIRQRCTYYSR